jgi:hypothetical protein
VLQLNQKTASIAQRALLYSLQSIAQIKSFILQVTVVFFEVSSFQASYSEAHHAESSFA